MCLDGNVTINGWLYVNGEETNKMAMNEQKKQGTSNYILMCGVAVQGFTLIMLPNKNALIWLICTGNGIR